MTGGNPHDTHLLGHIVGAVSVSLDDVLAAPAKPGLGRHPLPSAERFAEDLGALGIRNDASVVAYDDRGGAFASRLVWMLRILDQGAALLDGGLAAWNGAIETGPDNVEPVERSIIDWPARALADSTAVAAHIDDGGVVIDSREPRRYRGEVEPIDAVAGHVPGAINVPFAENLDDGSFKSPEQLRVRFAGVEADPNAIVYCGSGVTACHNALAIEASGLPLPRVYVGSWSGWTTEPSRPVARVR
jgi:thiosulfate/3-mercaptopyruvate sulfurtransferase